MRFALFKSAKMRFASLRFVPVRFAPVRVAAARFAPTRFAPVRLAPVRFAPSKFTLLRFALKRLPPADVHRTEVRPAEVWRNNDFVVAPCVPRDCALPKLSYVFFIRHRRIPSRPPSSPINRARPFPVSPRSKARAGFREVDGTDRLGDRR